MSLVAPFMTARAYPGFNRMKQLLTKVGKVLHMSLAIVTHTAGVYTGFHGVKQLHIATPLMGCYWGARHFVRFP